MEAITIDNAIPRFEDGKLDQARDRIRAMLGDDASSPAFASLDPDSAPPSADCDGRSAASKPCATP